VSFALTAIFSFLLGVLLSAASLGAFLQLCRSRSTLFVGQVIRAMVGQGVSGIHVLSIEHGWVKVGTLDLADAVERALPGGDELQPPAGGAPCG
jgi:hypothetical protein